MSILQAKIKFENGCLGPYTIGAVDDYVRGRIVAQQMKPVVLQDGERYAILAPPTKDFRVVCAGCFVPGMSLFDDGKCKRVSSFCQHLDLHKGERKASCKATGDDALEACLRRLDEGEEVRLDEGDAGGDVNVSKLTTEQLVQELASRGELGTVVAQVDTDDLVTMVKDRGVKVLIDARFEDLEQEMRRVVDGRRPTVEGFYFRDKIDGIGHVTDPPLIDRGEHEFLAMRGSIRNKRRRESWKLVDNDGVVLYDARSDAKRYKTRSIK